MSGNLYKSGFVKVGTWTLDKNEDDELYEGELELQSGEKYELLGVKYSKSNRDRITGSVANIPKEDIPIQYGIFDILFLPQNKVRSFLRMNPAHPQSLERIEVDKYF